MRQKTIITKLLQSVTEVYYKMRQVLQSATVITKWDVTPETRFFFLVLNNIYFLWAFGKSLRNNAPPSILSSILVFPAVSPALLTHFSTPPTQAHHSPYPRKPITYLTHAGTPPTSPTLSIHPHHPRWHATHASTPLMLALHPSKRAIYATHTSTPPTLPTLIRIAHHFSNPDNIYLRKATSKVFFSTKIFFDCCDLSSFLTGCTN